MNDNRSRNPLCSAGARPSESWLFAQELLGRPVDLTPEPPAETPAERELREWVESITVRGRSRSSVAPAFVCRPTHTPPAPATETAAERELREWVESITVREGDWDPALHPRGGFPENAGWFSPSGGGGGGGSSSHFGGQVPLRSWPEPVDRAEPHQKSSAAGRDRVPSGDQLAFQPQQRQPRVIRQGGRPEQQPQHPVAQPPSSKPFPNDFGTFPDRKDNPPKGDWKEGGPNHQLAKPLSDHLYQHANENIPKGIRTPLVKRGLQVVVVPKLSDVGRGEEGGRPGGIYSSSEGTNFVPQTLNDGKPNINAERDLRHEFGHAFDHATNGSTSREFLDAYEQDLKEQAPIKDLEMNHYIPAQGQIPRAKFDQLQKASPEQKAAGARETFAEATQPVKNGQPTDNNYRATAFRKTFPHTIEHMRKRVDKYRN